jgi:hypothetical protein
MLNRSLIVISNPSAPADTSAGKREEYLKKLEDRWLDKLSDNYKALNKNIIFLYTLLMILMLVQFKVVEKVEIGGSELKMSGDQWLLFMPVLILIPYFLVNNAVNQIFRIVNGLKMNSMEILQLNADARPFLNKDLEIYTQGIAGIQFQLAGWIVKYFLRREIMNIAFKIPEERNRRTLINFSLILPSTLLTWCTNAGSKLLMSLLWIIFLVLLYVLPLFCTIFVLVDLEIYPDLHMGKIKPLFPVYAVEIVFLLVMVFSTLASNWKLYLFYYEELRELKTEFQTQGFIRVRKGVMQVIHFYFPAKTAVG